MPSIFISGIPKGLDRTSASLCIRKYIERVAQVRTIGIQKDKGYGHVSLFDENSTDIVLSLNEKISINGKALRITKWRNKNRFSNTPRRTNPPACKNHVSNEVFVFRGYDTYTSYKKHQPQNDVLYHHIQMSPKKRKPRTKPWKDVNRLLKVPSPKSTATRTRRRTCKRKRRRMNTEQSTLSSNRKRREKRNSSALCNADNLLEELTRINKTDGTSGSNTETENTIQTSTNLKRLSARVHVYDHAKRLFSIEVDNERVLESIQVGLRSKQRWPSDNTILISHAGKIVSSERQPKMANGDNIHIIVKGRGGMKEGETESNEGPKKDELAAPETKTQGADIQEHINISKVTNQDKITGGDDEMLAIQQNQGDPAKENKQGKPAHPKDPDDTPDEYKNGREHDKGNTPDEDKQAALVHEDGEGNTHDEYKQANLAHEEGKNDTYNKYKQADPVHEECKNDTHDEYKQANLAHKEEEGDMHDEYKQAEPVYEEGKDDSSDKYKQANPITEKGKSGTFDEYKQGDHAHKEDQGDPPNDFKLAHPAHEEAKDDSPVEVQHDPSNVNDQCISAAIPGSAATVNDIVAEDRPIITHGASTAQEMVSSSPFKSTFLQGSEASQARIIAELGLDGYFPDQLTFGTVMSVKDYQNDAADSLSDIPRLMLRKLIMLDFTSREKYLNGYFNKSSSGRVGLTEGVPEVSSTVSNNDYDSLFNVDENVHDKVSSNVDKRNPIDVFLSVFICLHPTFKQKVCSKMFICHLAIPFIFPVQISERQSKVLMFSMWPLRSIIVNDGKTETSVVNCKQNVVSFLRLGRPPISKSKLANELLFDNAHHSFVNYDSTLGPIDKKACLGLVEASWFLPSPKENKTFTSVTLFLNLRGDAMHNSEQTEYLKKVSYVMIIVTDKETMKNREAMEYFKVAHSNVLFLLTGNVTNNFINKFKQFYMSSAPDGFSAEFVQVTENGQNISLSEIKETVLNIIGPWLRGKDSCKSVHDMCKQAQKLGIVVDEAVPIYKKGIEQAKLIFDNLRDCPLADIKSKWTPLQKGCWEKITAAMKKFRKAGQDIHIKEKLKCEMNSHRKIQWESMTPFMLHFIDIFTELHEDQLVAFLDSLKFELDEKSRKEMPAYRTKYADAWKKSKTTREANKDKALAAVSKAEQNLSDASFGIEHIFRELGQIYEASVIANKPRLSKQFANAVARSIKLGYPFELMDGDIANVPTKWIGRIFDELKDLLNDKKVLTLSILGLQSSGKSTLLNAMFGLMFSVSAGRCTRGIYLQLFPVCKFDFKFDYVLVVDTEGLRAPELGDQKHQHDNELATLVLGIADITLVNIKGENTSEVKDILQICVHAFLRLKMANKKLKLRQSCIFIHQNVSDVGAKDSMILARKKLDEILDKITLEAAEEENIIGIKRFKDVVNFDSNEHVWYFSDLWKGDPPMAPANPGYSRDVQNVKSLLFSTLAKERDNYLTISDTFVHIKDLWNGILANDFVFCFKNSLEIRAYNALENTYRGLIWILEKYTNHLTKDAEVKMKQVVANVHAAHRNERGLSQSMNETKEECLKMFHKKQLELKDDLKKHFDHTENKNDIAKWKNGKICSWEFFVEERMRKLKKHFNYMQEHCRVDFEVRTSLENSKKDIYGKAKALAEKMKGNRPSTKDMVKSFKEMWQKWIEELDVQEEHSDDIGTLLEKILYDTFQNHRDVVNTELNERRLDCCKLFKQMENSLDDFKFGKRYVSFKTKWLEYLPFVKGTDEKKVINDFTNIILREIDVRLLDLRGKEWEFDDTEIKEITQRIVKHINDHNQDKKNYFTLLEPYKVRLVVHVFACALPLLESLDSEYKAKHSMKTKLKNHETVVWRHFQDVVDEKSATLIASDRFCEVIRDNVEEVVRSQLPHEIFEDIVQDFSLSKRRLMTYILKELAEKNDALSFRAYIEDPYTYAFQWLKGYIDDKCFNHNLYTEKATSGLNRKFEVISKSLENNSVTRCLHDWIISFQNDIKDTVWITIESFFAVEDQTITNLDDFLTTIKTDLEKVLVELEEKFKQETKRSFKWYNDKTPYKLSIDKLWGCKAVCPFCKEPCQWDLSHTGIPHSCIQHRASGVSGRRWTKTKKLAVESCSFDLQAGNRFSCKKPCKGGLCKNTSNDDLSHPYREYRDYIPDWDIHPCPDMSSSYYWAWVISTFNEHFAKCYRAEKADIPEGWEKYTKDKAIESLYKID